MKVTIISLLGILFFLGCELEDPEKGILTSDIIKIETDVETIFADGNDRVLVTATLGKLGGANQSITFRTDQGSFAGSENAKELSITTSGKSAQVYLISDLVTNNQVTVSAKAGNFSTNKTVAFTEALPDDILISTDKLKLIADRTDKILLTINLYRNGGGKPSSNIRVNFSQSIVGSNNLQALAVQNFGFVENGVLVLPITTRNDSIGMIQIKAELDKDRSISDSVLVELYR